MSLRRRYFLNLAAAEALKSPVRLKVGCVLVERNKIVSKGYNNYCTSGPNITRHAEVDAVMNLALREYKGKDR